jgi:AraC-like DNA-binding protein
VSLRAERNALVYAREAWRAPVAGRDALLQRTLRRHAEVLLDRSARAARGDVAERVRAALLQRVRVGLPPVEAVARALGLGPRTLQRRLRAQGVTFAGLADEVRASLAREYLGDPGLNVSEVAYLLGFSEPSAFTRAFRRWTGKTPMRFRLEA